jgi:predicted PurR-regulated permease PerM
MENNLKKYSKYLFIGVFLIIAILTFLILKPFISAFLTSIVFSYLFYPVYKKLNNHIKNNSISAAIMVVLLILIIIIPTFFFINLLLKESLLIYNYVKSEDLNLNPYFYNALNKIFQYFLNEFSDLIINIPKFLINSFITIFLFYYFLKDGDKLIEQIKSLIPMDNKHKEGVVREFKNVTHSIVYGLILTGIITGLFSALGFYIFKISSPLFWAIVVMILTILPGIGTWLVWVPIGILKIMQEDLFNGVGVLIFSLIFISGVELMLKPKLIGEKSNLHPALIVIGVFGGIKILGFIGIFFGPLILVTFITFLKSVLNKR